MVRGRKKDMSIPVSRTIALQRDYRERKAKYVAHLEDKCKSLEEQNARLIEEVKELRRLSSSKEQNNPGSGLECGLEEVTKNEAFGNVIKTLSAAMSSIQNFQHLAEGQDSPHSSSSTPPTSVTSSSSLSSDISSPSSYSAFRMQSSARCLTNIAGRTSFSPAVDSYASDHPSATPSPSPSFGDAPGSQINYQRTGNASDNSYSASHYWDETSSARCLSYFGSDKPNVRQTTNSELLPPQGSALTLQGAAKALSDLSSNVLMNHSAFRSSSSVYPTTLPSVSGYADNIVSAGQPSHMRSSVYGGGYGMPIRGESYMPASG
ncbi:hypothetical protein J3R30DRAFT_3694293 [Lentinula aciculospora]|uniref:BZIP domain-containing protein n=1 Tax=Lentinula aciculospora TaxID=153920 RepID=A0A9W9DX48_9AGAR|nr:hypothetical protein J3R30DRAFT_3694293 [Lentinula aciculospora]